MLGVSVQNLVPQEFVHPCCRSYPNWAPKPMEIDQIRYTEFEVFVIGFKICILMYLLFGTMPYISTSSQWRQNDTEWG